MLPLFFAKCSLPHIFAALYRSRSHGNSIQPLCHPSLIAHDRLFCRRKALKRYVD